MAEADSEAERRFPDDLELLEAEYRVSRKRAVPQNRLPAESQGRECWMAEPMVNSADAALVLRCPEPLFDSGFAVVPAQA